MASGWFDPYLRWLGIRDPERPPNHYRLLGLDLFETDPEVISEGADRQMGHVRTHQHGENAETSQRLLNELARAKVCLLNVRRKEAYDKHLRAKLELAAKTAPPPPAVPSLPAPPPKGKPAPLHIRLVITAGPQTGTVFTIEEKGTFTLGRSKQATLAVPGDQSMSRIQFSIRVTPPCVFIKNLSETHGTQVNGRMIQESLLKDGDTVLAGQQTEIQVTITKAPKAGEAECT